MKKKIKIDKNDPDYEIKNYLNTVKPHKAFRGIREDDMWTIISNVQKYYHEKTERIRAIYQEKNNNIGGEKNEKNV